MVKKDDCATVDVTVKVQRKMQFSKPLSATEIKQAILEEDSELIYDIMDEDELEIISVDKIKFDFVKN